MSLDPAFPVWIDDQLVDAHAALIPVADRGFTLGDGVFETMLWIGDEDRAGICGFAAHMARLSHAAASLGLAPDVDEGAIARKIRQLCGQTPGTKAVRLTLTRGSGPRGLAVPQPAPPPRLILNAAPWTAPAGPLGRIARSSVMRAPGAPSSRFKTLSYIDCVEALRQAQALGADDAILVGIAGEPLCASAASLIVVREGTAFTPPVSSGALPGITRGVLMAAGLVREAPVSWADLQRADALLMVNALIGVRSVTRFEDRTFPGAGPVGASLAAAITRHRHTSLPQFEAALASGG
jgi:branched-chain amino acid aminotransferase